MASSVHELSLGHHTWTYGVNICLLAWAFGDRHGDWVSKIPANFLVED